ncbi:SAF domain-containing protein [Streptomyces daliensis]|uniref:SAF domain-containing protein n=1 Tax=Streptomyces daliensis TaxID=299421 RepID=A0A8T4IZJ6_9ACTN|nr:SAF domain-containing protein [Streptomyces daliensis]
MTAMRRRRQLPYLALGAVLVLSCATAGVVVGAHLDDREAVLVAARAVSVGQELAARDVRQVSMATDSGLEPIPASSLPQVEGRRLAYSLPAGAVLTKDAVGGARIPPAGQAVAAVGLKPGQFPSSLERGSRVVVVVAASEGSSSGGSSTASSSLSWSATVSDIQLKDNGQTTVVSLQTGTDDARHMAAVPEGQLRVVTVSGGGS